MPQFHVVNVYDLVMALVLAIWVGLAGVLLIKWFFSLLTQLSYRISNQTKLFELEYENADLLKELCELKGDRKARKVIK